MRLATRTTTANAAAEIYFDASYYKRFYLTAGTRAMSQAETERRGALVASLVRQLELPVRRVLDMGCGLGWFKRPITKMFPKVRYTGVEFSAYLCENYGWEHGSVVDYRGRGSFDLVICCDVLQYLDKDQAAAALENLARLCTGALYLHVPTKQDWRTWVDPSGTDQNVHVRSGAWYRKQLRRHFVHVGQGVHLRRGTPFMQWELESPWR